MLRRVQLELKQEEEQATLIALLNDGVATGVTQRTVPSEVPSEVALSAASTVRNAGYATPYVDATLTTQEWVAASMVRNGLATHMPSAAPLLQISEASRDLVGMPPTHMPPTHKLRRPQSCANLQHGRTLHGEQLAEMNLRLRGHGGAAYAQEAEFD